MTQLGILDRSPYAKVWAKINNIKVHSKDRFRGRDIFPIGTKKPIFTYNPEEDIPESEMKFFKFDTVKTNDATSILCCGQSGTMKTTLIKTLTYYSSLIGNTKVGVIDLKGPSLDWKKCNFDHNNPGMIYQESAKMNFETGCPRFALRDMPIEDAKKIRQMNLPPPSFANQQLLTGLGFSLMAKQHLYRMLSEGLTMDMILKQIDQLSKKGRIIKSTYENLTNLLDNMIRSGFFADKNFFDINEIWDRDYAWALGFNNKETAYLSVYVDKILNEVFDRANTARGRKERYHIVVDDCQKAFGQDPTKYPSVQTGIATVTQWRSCGVNMVFGIQCLLPNNWIRLKDGRLRKIEDLYELHKKEKNLFINNCPENNKTTLITSTIKNITKQSGRRKAYIIKTRNGNEIKITDNHFLFVNRKKANHYKDKIMLLPAQDIKIGDWLLSNLKEETFYNDNIIVNLPLVGDKMFCNSMYKRGFGRSSIPLINKLTPELSRFIGYVLSDGHISIKGVDFSKPHRMILEDFLYCVEKVFGIKLYIDEKRLRIRFNNIAMKQFLEQLGVKDKSSTKEVPDCIMQSSLLNKSNFLRAYFDCDGCSSSETVVFYSTSKNITQSIFYLLKEFGIVSSLNLKKNRKGAYANALPLYSIRIRGRIELEKFKQFNTIKKIDTEKYKDKDIKCSHYKNRIIQSFLVTNIEKIDYEGDYYDIEVNDNHNFFTGTFGSILSHNSPTMLDKEIYADIKHFFIYRTANLDVLRNYIPNREIIEQAKTLLFQPERHISECIHVFPDRQRFERFFPSNSIIAN